MKIKKPRTPKIYNSPNIPYLEVDLKIVFRVSRLDKIDRKGILLISHRIRLVLKF